MPEPTTCDSCGRRIAPHGHYIVRIDVFADPSMPPISEEELARTNFDATLDDLLNEMRNRSADELMDDVHCHFDFKICRECQRKFIKNPLTQCRDDL